jgi:hypothetical protein
MSQASETIREGRDVNMKAAMVPQNDRARLVRDLAAVQAKADQELQGLRDAVEAATNRLAEAQRARTKAVAMLFAVEQRVDSQRLQLERELRAGAPVEALEELRYDITRAADICRNTNASDVKRARAAAERIQLLTEAARDIDNRLPLAEDVAGEVNKIRSRLSVPRQPRPASNLND